MGEGRVEGMGEVESVDVCRRGEGGGDDNEKAAEAPDGTAGGLTTIGIYSNASDGRSARR